MMMQFFFFCDYSYDTLFPQHSSDKKNILKTFFGCKILQCSPYRMSQLKPKSSPNFLAIKR